MTEWKTPEELIFLAEESTSPPPHPKGGIPKQRIPPWIRWPIRLLVVPFVILDLTMQRFVRMFFKTPYKQTGACTQRGNCCYYILFPVPNNWLNKLFYLWNTEINGFYPRDTKPLQVDEDQFLVMGCRYLRQNGSCSRYSLRPSICRTWPQIEYFGRPKILKGCGFKAVPRDKNFDPYPQQPAQPSSNKLNILK